MEVRKEGNRTVIDLTKDEEFNKYITYLDKCRKREKIIVPILLSLFGLLIVFYVLMVLLG